MNSIRGVFILTYPFKCCRTPPPPARAQIGFGVFEILKNKKLKQRKIAEVLGIPQPEVSHFMNGHFSRFTTDKLLDFLKRLDRKVIIKIGPQKRGEPYQVIGFAS